MVANTLTPGLSPDVNVRGSLIPTDLGGRTSTLDATCLWAPGRESVARVRTKLPGGIGDLSGRILVIDLEGAPSTSRRAARPSR